MLYNYNLSQEAEDDMFEAYIWYEQQRAGLGEEFFESLDKARMAILQNPLTYRTWYKKKVRAFLIDRFPYMILYVVQKENVDVISVFNTSRDPKTWKKRVK